MDDPGNKLHARALEILRPWLLENRRGADDYSYEEYGQALIKANEEFTEQRTSEILADRGVRFPTQEDYREAATIARGESSEQRELSRERSLGIAKGAEVDKLLTDLRHDQAVAILERTGKAMTAENYTWALDEAARKFGTA